MNSTAIMGIVGLIFASNGLWTFLTYLLSKRYTKKDIVERGLLAVLHDRLYQVCKFYIAKKEITVEELDNIKYLYEAYHELGGNGTGTVLYEKCKELKIIEQ